MTTISVPNFCSKTLQICSKISFAWCSYKVFRICSKFSPWFAEYLLQNIFKTLSLRCLKSAPILLQGQIKKVFNILFNRSLQKASPRSHFKNHPRLQKFLQVCTGIASNLFKDTKNVASKDLQVLLQICSKDA